MFVFEGQLLRHMEYRKQDSDFERFVKNEFGEENGRWLVSDASLHGEYRSQEQNGKDVRGEAELKKAASPAL